MAHTFVRAYIGLGSNLDHPEEQLRRAIEALGTIPASRLTAVSRLYRSSPMGPAEQPDYLNAVAMLDTRLEPLALLDALQAIEQQQGRVREGKRWGPRTLDLDLLLYGIEVIAHPRLSVPHPGMKQRNFVLHPLAELAPELHFPDGSSLQDALRETLPGRLEVLDRDEDDSATS
ncbi:MAG: 2-amino-4-hydroxy-6-hydroxymethyldihydropteridine diphosphokinase [Gammaproteobacteria bacterium]|nr:2-amino-4-hydroxy-6-hydroxymethyldihydropteridine diphosphokinase [Gammaproteobacteria bacterium]